MFRAKVQNLKIYRRKRLRAALLRKPVASGGIANAVLRVLWKECLWFIIIEDDVIATSLWPFDINIQSKSVCLALLVLSAFDFGGAGVNISMEVVKPNAWSLGAEHGLTHPCAARGWLLSVQPHGW